MLHVYKKTIFVNSFNGHEWSPKMVIIYISLSILTCGWMDVLTSKVSQSVIGRLWGSLGHALRLWFRWGTRAFQLLSLMVEGGLGCPQADVCIGCYPWHLREESEANFYVVLDYAKWHCRFINKHCATIHYETNHIQTRRGVGLWR